MTEKKIRMATSENHDEQGHTIVGGRPQANKSKRTDIPRGLELLIKRAAIDEAFKNELLQKRDKLVDEMHIPLDPSEKAMLSCVPVEHLEKMIMATVVPPSQRKVIAAGSAAAMIALFTQLTFAPVTARAETQPNTQQLAEMLETPDLNNFAVLPAPTGSRPDSPIKEDSDTTPVFVKGIRPDLPASDQDLVKPVIDEYEDHLADRGARPDFPPDLLIADPEPTNVTRPDDFPPELVGEPFEKILTENTSNRNLGGALALISKTSGLTIKFTDLDPDTANSAFDCQTEGLTVAQALQAVCGVISTTFSHTYSYDPTTETLMITFKKRSSVNLKPEPFTKPESPSICRGIRSDMPSLKKNQIDDGDGDSK